MNVEQFCTSIIDRVYTSIRHDCSDGELLEVYSTLADHFQEKGLELFNKVNPPGGADTEEPTPDADPSTPVEHLDEIDDILDGPESEVEACAVEADREPPTPENDAD